MNLPDIYVYGLVHDFVVRVSIYLTQYRNVIRIDVPQTPDIAATLYTIHIDTVAKFLKEYFDKTPITVVLDNSDGSDTEAYTPLAASAPALPALSIGHAQIFFRRKARHS